MKKLFYSIIILSMLAPVCLAQTKRAIVIGIDNYKPTATTPDAYATRGCQLASHDVWPNLHGCINDANAMKDVIITRFGFEEKNIVTMLDKEATRVSILDALNELVMTAQKGDIVLFYYAGHGSTIKNSLSVENLKEDQTIVPSDMYDIRDKELAHIWNLLLDKGVKLTLIFDSCHSGSIARGQPVPVEVVTRQMCGVEDMDSKDPSCPIAPEKRGALVISAAQAERCANEWTDDNQQKHGLFTCSLLKAMSLGSANESAGQLFTRVEALMAQAPFDQRPIFGGDNNRRNESLIGTPASSGSASITIPIIEKVDDKTIRIRGGYELLLYKGTRFAKIGGTDTIEIDSVYAIGNSTAHAIGKSKIGNFKIGDLVQQVSWVCPGEPLLRVWFPDSKFTIEELNSKYAAVSKLCASGYCRLVIDPAKEVPDEVIQWNGTKWVVTTKGQQHPKELKDFTDASLRDRLGKGRKVFFQAPPTAKLISKIKTQIGSKGFYSAIEITNDALAANYLLIGHGTTDGMEYCLFQSTFAGDTGVASSLPKRTDWQSATGTNDSLIAFNIGEHAFVLGKIHTWLTLNGPGDYFPYNLAIRKKLPNGQFKYFQPGESLAAGEYTFVLLFDSTFVPEFNYPINRYFYITIIQQDGKMFNYFPGDLGNDKTINNFTYIPSNPKKEIPVTTFTVGKPFGTDTYMLMFTQEPISPFVFNTEAVVTRGGDAPANALDAMLQNFGSGERGVPASTGRWSVQRVQHPSVPK